MDKYSIKFITEDKMPEDKLEVVFDEILWNLLESAQKHGLTTAEVQTVLKALHGFCHHQNFNDFYEKKFNTTQERFKTLYARAFNVQRYLIEDDQVQSH